MKTSKHLKPLVAVPAGICIAALVACASAPAPGSTVPAALDPSGAILTSATMTPDGNTVEAEAAHGTVTRHYRMHQEGKPTSTNPIASIFAWTGGLKFRGKFDETPEVTRFAETLEEVCIQTVEDGHMTKDLAILIGPDQAWMTTEQFFEQVRANLEIKMGSWQ